MKFKIPFLGRRLESNSRWDSQVEGGDRQAREPHPRPGGTSKGPRRGEQHQGGERRSDETFKPISTWRSISNEIFLVFRRLHLFICLSLSLPLSFSVSQAELSSGENPFSRINDGVNRTHVRCFPPHASASFEEIFVINSVWFFYVYSEKGL